MSDEPNGLAEKLAEENKRYLAMKQRIRDILLEFSDAPTEALVPHYTEEIMKVLNG